MARKQYTAEQIIKHLREAENHLCKGCTVGQVCIKIGILTTRTHEGLAVRILAIMDEYTWGCLAIKTARRITSQEFIEQLTDLFIVRGLHGHIKSDNGPEFTAKAVRQWFQRLGVQRIP